MKLFKLLLFFLFAGVIGTTWTFFNGADFVQTDERLPKLASPPEEINAVYLTSWSAGNEDKIKYVIRLASTTEVNAVVFNIKDYSGYIAYDTKLPEVEQYGAEQIIISDVASLVARLHDKGIYVIARMVVFQDAVLAEAKPEWAIHSASKRALVSNEKFSKETLWHDHSGGAWIDPAAQGAWNYFAAIIREVDALGFDEINFDYIRFPSDGDIMNTVYPVWDEVTPARTIIKDFFAFLRQEFPETKLSVDVFGILMARQGDEGIGQVLEDAYEYFDYVSPMLYPSHYAPGFSGYENPAEHPYEIVYEGLKQGLERLVQFEAFEAATSTGNAEIRPWLQNFDLGADYDDVMVRQEIQATRDALGDRFKGFMLWSPSNIYSEGALQ